MLPMQLSFRKLLGARFASSESIPTFSLSPSMIKLKSLILIDVLHIFTKQLFNHEAARLLKLNAKYYVRYAALIRT